MSPAALLAVDGVRVEFGGVVALQDLGFSVAEGEICALIGPNGAGKTTLFNVVSRLYECGEGSIRFAGRDLLALPPHRIARVGIARTFQNLALFDSMTVRDTVLGRSATEIRRTYLCFDDFDVLRDIAADAHSVQLVDSSRLHRIKEGPERRIATLAALGVTGLNMHQSDWNGGLVTLAHRFERLAFAWDAQFEPVLVGLLRMGIDAVYSDWVDRMVDAARTSAR